MEERLYERLGVRRFKRELPTGGDRYTDRLGWHPILERAGGLVSALERYEARTKFAERVHVVNSLLLMAGAIFLALHEVYALATLVVALHLLVNVYPIMVQRYNRARILRLLDRLRKRASQPGEPSPRHDGHH